MKDREEDILDKEKELFYMFYTLTMLHYRGISVSETVKMSLQCLRDWFFMSGEIRYLELAILQMRVCFELEISPGENLELYQQICEIAQIDVDRFLNEKLYLVKKVRLNQTQVRKLFRKWMPSRSNPMTITEVTDDVISKIKQKQIGSYIYSCRSIDSKEDVNFVQMDIYELIINQNECFFIDLKNFQLYAFL